MEKKPTDTILNFTDSVHYIETLYIQTNLYSHVAGELSNDKKHKIAMDKLYDEVLSKAEFLGHSNTRDWYRTDNYKIGVITDYDKAMQCNWYSCVIQYFQHHMWECMADINKLELPLTSNRELYNIQRADATLIYKSDIDYLNGYGIISKYRKQHTIEKSGVIETKYLGSRPSKKKGNKPKSSSGNMVRWYNKTNELKDTENYKKIELLSKTFGDIEDLYTIELEMNREFLLRTMNIDSLNDFNKLKLAYKNIIGTMRVYKLTDENRKHIADNHRNRVTACRFAEWVEYERVVKKKYEPSVKYLIDRMAKSSNRYLDTIPNMDDRKKESLKVINLLMERVVISDGLSDMVVTYEPSELGLEIEYMDDKIESYRGFNDLLQVEAQRAFSPYKYNPKLRKVS